MYRKLSAASLAPSACGQRDAKKGEAAAPAPGAQIAGAGATFPASLYAEWAKAISPPAAQ